MTNPTTAVIAPRTPRVLYPTKATRSTIIAPGYSRTSPSPSSTSSRASHRFFTGTERTFWRIAKPNEVRPITKNVRNNSRTPTRLSEPEGSRDPEGGDADTSISFQWFGRRLSRFESRHLVISLRSSLARSCRTHHQTRDRKPRSSPLVLCSLNRVNRSGSHFDANRNDLRSRIESGPPYVDSPFRGRHRIARRAQWARPACSAPRRPASRRRLLRRACRKGPLRDHRVGGLRTIPCAAVPALRHMASPSHRARRLHRDVLAVRVHHRSGDLRLIVFAYADADAVGPRDAPQRLGGALQQVPTASGAIYTGRWQRDPITRWRTARILAQNRLFRP